MAKSKRAMPREAVAKERPRHKRGCEDNARCPAPSETTLSFPLSQAPGRDDPQSRLLPPHLSGGAGDSSAAGQERAVGSSPKSSLQFCVRNSTSTFTCTHQSLAFSAGAGKCVKRPFPLLPLASAQKAVAVGLLCQAATPLEHWLQRGGRQGPPKSQALTGRQGCSRLLPPAYLLGHLQRGLQREQVLVGWAQQVGRKADGQVAAAHPAGGGVVGDVLEEGQQPLEEEEIGCRQLLGHPEGTGTHR